MLTPVDFKSMYLCTFGDQSMTDQELQEIRDRCERATPGPWEYKFYNDSDMNPQAVVKAKKQIASILFPTQQEKDNFEFIAHARTDIPRLLDEIERLRTVLKRIANCTVFDADVAEAMAREAQKALGCGR